MAPRAAQPSALAIGAPSGMNTSQGTPRTRAACDSAQAWLPALPAVTPRAQPSPSVASLFSAPRILKEPVRWRFSAFSATARPVCSESVSEGSTGVCLATSAIAARARAIAPGVTARLPAAVAIAIASIRQRDDRVDLDLHAPRERGDADRHARGRI